MQRGVVTHGLELWINASSFVVVANSESGSERQPEKIAQPYAQISADTPYAVHTGTLLKEGEVGVRSEVEIAQLWDGA